jgi:hypothetical protein
MQMVDIDLGDRDQFDQVKKNLASYFRSIAAQMETAEDRNSLAEVVINADVQTSDMKSATIRYASGIDEITLPRLAESLVKACESDQV